MNDPAAKEELKFKQWNGKERTLYYEPQVEKFFMNTKYRSSDTLPPFSSERLKREFQLKESGKHW